MDSRIEELAEVILERAKSTADALNESAKSTSAQVSPQTVDRYKAYRRCEWLAVEVLTVIHDYRCDHREEH